MIDRDLNCASHGPPPKITHAIVYDASQPPQDNDGAGTRHVICTDVPIQQGGCKGRAVSHEGAPICAGCGEDWPCSDSVAEAQVQADEEAERSLRARYNDLLVDHARLAAQVLRVRDACVSSHVDDKGKKVVFLDRIQRALDGAE